MRLVPVDFSETAFRALYRHPGRSIMTMLGLTIGVGAFIAMVSFGEGARRTVLAQFEALGVNVLRVAPLLEVKQPRGTDTRPLTERDVQAIRRESTATAYATPIMRRSTAISYGSKRQLTLLYGTEPRFVPAHFWRFAQGGMFDESDMAARAKVCVLGETPRRKLFGDRDALGETVHISETLSCKVIGVLASKGTSTNGSDLDDVVLMPVTTYRTYVDQRDEFTFIEVEPSRPELLDTARNEVTEILRRTHELEAGDFDDFLVSTPAEVVRAVQRTSSILKGLLQGIAGVALLVGGLGIMNIQLVSVAERVKEIGIRAAIGASPRQIMLQFLAEALVLSLVGAAAGVVLGMTLASVVAKWMGWVRVISPGGIALSASFGIGVGVLFGLLPARRAAQLDPVEALRRE
jgi:putative ABC transport system permease protein